MVYGRRRGVFRILFSIEAETVTLHYVRHSAQGPIEPWDSIRKHEAVTMRRIIDLVTPSS
jgi:hypothetical protein